MIAALALLLSIQTAADASAPPPADPQAQQQGARIEAPGAATKAATGWLALVDAGDLARSWQASGSLFRARVTQASWTQQLSQARTPLGAVVSRTPAGEQPLDALPDAPAGHYRILRFDTDFANQKGAVETVVTVQEGGDWRVVGYFIADGSDDGTGDSPPPSTRR